MKYNRIKMEETIKAIKRIQEIKERRERLFMKNRMKIKKKVELEEAYRDLKQINLIQAPDELRKRPVEIKTTKATEKALNTNQSDDMMMEY